MLEKYLEELRKQDEIIEKAERRKKQIKKLNSEKERKLDNHRKIQLGGAFIKSFKAHMPTDRKQEKVFTDCVQKVFERHKDSFVADVLREFEAAKLKYPDVFSPAPAQPAEKKYSLNVEPDERCNIEVVSPGVSSEGSEQRVKSDWEKFLDS